MIPDYSYLSHQLSHQTTGSTSSSSPLSTYSEKSYDRSSPLSRDEFAAVKLSDVLSVLDEEDESCIFIVRRVSKLGYAARDALDRYFSWHYGPVKRILLLPSRGKGDSRTRPASMGFVVMANRSDCKRIYESSDSYRVNGVDVQVQRFMRNAKVQVVTDGCSVTNAYVPATFLQGKAPVPMPEEREVISLDTSTVTLAQIETIAESMLNALRL